MGNKRFTAQEEEQVIEEIRLLLIRGYQRYQIQKVCQARYERTERQVDRYLAIARQRLAAFGDEPVKDLRGRLLARSEWLYAIACQGQEVNALQALKAMEFGLKVVTQLAGGDDGSQTETPGTFPGLLDALQDDGGAAPAE